MNHLLDVRRLEKSYKGITILSHISFTLEKGEIVAILGPSGCGKTTLMRCLAGLEKFSTGEILLHNRSISKQAPDQRPVVLMFQDPLLFPHMTVLENVIFGLKQQKLAKKKRMELGIKMLVKTEMENFKERFPRSLSGGQQQRVALARALVMKPSLLLLDEPFSSLDQHLKEMLRDWVCSLLKEEGVTTMIVTHDKEEAMMIGDRVILLKDGSIQQQGKPNKVYQFPDNENVEGMFSDGIQVGGAFVPSQHLRLAPFSEGESIHFIAQGIISNFFYKYGLCFYQVIMRDGNQKVILHSKRDFEIGSKVLILNENN